VFSVTWARFFRHAAVHHPPGYGITYKTYITSRSIEKVDDAESDNRGGGSRGHVAGGGMRFVGGKLVGETGDEVQLGGPRVGEADLDAGA
jgi:hypothetical protein